MRIYEHFLFNFALFHRKPWAWKVGVGGILPDLVYMLPFMPRMLSYESFMEWMLDPLWDKIWNSWIAKSVHSTLVWGFVLILCWVLLGKRGFRFGFPFLIGWGLHIIFDAFTHVSDGYALFFPISDYRVPSLVSYWEVEHHAREYFWITHSLMTAFLLFWVGSKLRKLWHSKR